MMKSITLVALTLISSYLNSFSQIGNSLNTIFFHNNYIDNPASISPKNIKTGIAGSLSDNNFNDIKSTVAYVSSPLYQQQMGIGVRFTANRAGGSNEKRLNVGGAYHLLVARDTLTIGLEVGLSQRTFNFNSLLIDDETDPILSESLSREYHQNINVGLYFSPRKYDFSASIKSLNRLVISNNNTDNHISIWGARKFSISDKLKLKTGVKIDKFNERSAIYTAIAEGQYSGVGSISAAYLSINVISLQATLTMNRYFKVFDPILLGYSYNHNLSDLAFYTHLTHQLFINYSFRKKPAKGRIRKSTNSINPNYY